jgi:hypothetical protein
MARRRPLTAAECLDAWRAHGELVGGHRPSETIGLISELQDLEEDQQHALPAGFCPAEAAEPWWLTRLRGRFGH